MRSEDGLTKEQILELYLNEIPLGRRSFGVQAASRAYFDKEVDQLQLHEMAFLAILPKAPEKYGRTRFESEALARRNFVLGSMEDNGWITAAQRDAARAMPLGLTDRGNRAVAQVGERKRVGEGESVSVRVDLGGRRIIKKKKK